MKKTSARVRLGTCLRVSYERCDARLLDDPIALTRCLREVAKLSGLRIVKAVSHRYRPQGVTVVLILKESHLVLHSWPEHGAAVLELFSCAPRTPVKKIEAALKTRLKAAVSRPRTAFVDVRPAPR